MIIIIIDKNIHFLIQDPTFLHVCHIQVYIALSRMLMSVINICRPHLILLKTIFGDCIPTIGSLRKTQWSVIKNKTMLRKLMSKVCCPLWVF